MKSGICGGLVAIVPGKGAIASYNPVLDDTGIKLTTLSKDELQRSPKLLTLE